MTRQNKRVIVWVQLMPAISELALLLHFVLAVGWGYHRYQLPRDSQDSSAGDLRAPQKSME